MIWRGGRPLPLGGFLVVVLVAIHRCVGTLVLEANGAVRDL